VTIGRRTRRQDALKELSVDTPKRNFHYQQGSRNSTNRCVGTIGGRTRRQDARGKICQSTHPKESSSSKTVPSALKNEATQRGQIVVSTKQSRSRDQACDESQFDRDSHGLDKVRPQRAKEIEHRHITTEHLNRMHPTGNRQSLTKSHGESVGRIDWCNRKATKSSAADNLEKLNHVLNKTTQTVVSLLSFRTQRLTSRHRPNFLFSSGPSLVVEGGQILSGL